MYSLRKNYTFYNKEHGDGKKIKIKLKLHSIIFHSLLFVVVNVHRIVAGNYEKGCNTNVGGKANLSFRVK